MHDLQESYCKGTVFKKCVIWYKILLLEKHMSYCIHKKTKCATKLIHFSQNACLLYKIFVDYFRMLFSILGCFTGVFCTSSDIVYGLGNQIAMEAFISFTKFDV